MGDAVAHQATTEYANLVNLHRNSTLPTQHPQITGKSDTIM